jgi:hypothetical protein
VRGARPPLDQAFRPGVTWCSFLRRSRADWVDRELPDVVDTYKNDSLLQMLGVDPATISPADPPIHIASRQR